MALFAGTQCLFWNTAGVPVGSYFIRAQVLDNVNIPVYSDTPVVIEVQPPQMSLEAPANGAAVSQPFPVSGWAIHPGNATTGVTGVHVYATPVAGGPAVFLGVATYGVPRPDIGGIFGPQFTNSGFSLTATGLGPGVYRIDAFALSNVTGTFNNVRSATVTVSSSARMALDSPVNGQSVFQPFQLGGWAIDGAAASGTGVDTVHVYAVPAGGGPATFVGQATYGLPRPDIAGFFGDARFTNSGFGLTIGGLGPGGYQLLIFARSTATGTFSNVSSVNITVASGGRMAIDGPTPGSRPRQPFVLSGWAIDLGGVAGPGVDTVHVYAVPLAGGPASFLGAASYGVPRPDIAGFFGNARFTNSGFGLTISGLSPGAYQLLAFARSTATGTFSNSLGVTITVFTDGRLAIDAPLAGAVVGSAFPVTGWALDLGVSSGTGVDAVHVYAFPAGGGAPIFLGEAAYGTPRSDVAGFFGPQYVNVGYVLNVSGLAPGAYQLNVFARSAVTATFTQVQSIPITVTP
jgi:hypothetical protein